MGTDHYLHTPWMLWYDNPHSRLTTKTYGSTLQKITSFSSVEEFWRVYHSIKKPSQFGIGSTYRLFRQGITPAWESPECREGGEWIISLNRKDEEKADHLWLFLVLACIGETLELSEIIAGCNIAVKKPQIRLSVWLTTTDQTPVLRLGQSLNKLAQETDPHPVLEFKSFSDQLLGKKNVLYSFQV